VAALQKYGQAINGSPTVPGLRTALGNFLLQSGQWQKADREFQEELTVDPFSYEAQLGLARTAWAQQHCDAAVDDLDKAVAIRPEFFDPLVDIFSDLPAHGDGTACAAIEKLANGHESFGAALLLGRLAEDRGQSGQAASWHDRAEARRDELIQKFRAAAGATPVTTPSLTVRENLGLQLLQRKRYVEGLALLSPFLAKASTAPEIIVPEARALFALKRYPDVINLLSRGRPGTPEEYYLRGASCHQLAWQLIQRIEEVDPQSARLDELRASAFAAEQMLPEAVREYETAIKLEPDNARLYFDLGNTHIDEREFTKAEAAYAQACRLKPLFAEAYAMRGYALLALSRPGEAVPQLRRALQINPDLMSAHALLAKALAGSGHEAEAAKELEIVKCTDTDGGLHFQLFVLYRRLGNSEKATQALNDSERIRREQRQSLENDVGPPIPSGFQVESNN
jgi:tetratricopeptide (TPR) repeat protein